MSVSDRSTARRALLPQLPAVEKNMPTAQPIPAANRDQVTQPKVLAFLLSALFASVLGHPRHAFPFMKRLEYEVRRKNGARSGHRLSMCTCSRRFADHPQPGLCSPGCSPSPCLVSPYFSLPACSPILPPHAHLCPPVSPADQSCGP